MPFNWHFKVCYKYYESLNILAPLLNLRKLSSIAVVLRNSWYPGYKIGAESFLTTRSARPRFDKFQNKQLANVPVLDFYYPNNVIVLLHLNVLCRSYDNLKIKIVLAHFRRDFYLKYVSSQLSRTYSNEANQRWYSEARCPLVKLVVNESM